MDAAALWDDRTLYGQLLETFVYQELRRHASWREEPVTFHHFRDKDGAEVDIVLESGGKLAGVEVKAATVTAADAVASFCKGLYAVPLSFSVAVTGESILVPTRVPV